MFNLFHGMLYICLLQKYDTWEKLSHHFLYIFLPCNFWPSYSHCALHSVLAFSTGKWKWKWNSLSHVWFLVSHGLYRSWNSPGQTTGGGSCSFLQGISQLKDQTQVSCVARGWAAREAWEYWSLSFLQGIFLTHESNQGLLQGSQIIYQLSYQGLYHKYIPQCKHLV